MIRIKINRGRHLIFSVPILLLFVFIFFYSCASLGPISKEDRDSIKSVRISINKSPKIGNVFHPDIYVNLDNLDKKTTDIFGLVQSNVRAPVYIKELCKTGRYKMIRSKKNIAFFCRHRRVVAAAPVYRNSPFVFVFFSGLQSLQLSRFEGPYTNDPTVKNYWDTNGVIDGVIEGTNFERMIEFMVQKQNIDTAEIVREEFVRELKRSGLFPSIVSEGGDAEINLTIMSFYITHYSGFEKITFSIWAKIINSDGDVLWNKVACRTNLSSEIPKRLGTEYLNNRDLIIKDIKKLAQILSMELIKKARGGS